VVNVIGGAYGPLNYFFLALAVVAFGFEAWAFIDAMTRPAQAYLAAGKLTKTKWLLILGVAFVLGLYSAAYGGVTGFLSVLAFVAAAIYLSDVRPKVKEYRTNTHAGPYGP
jgi:drug/metabolite transporter superfamily protein YnfA